MSHSWEEAVRRSQSGPRFVVDPSENYGQMLERFNKEVAALPVRKPETNGYWTPERIADYAAYRKRNPHDNS
jgi:Ethanolamine utilization protein EutJ (predicted chaperonin)